MTIMHFDALPAAGAGIAVSLNGGHAQDFDITNASAGWQFTNTGYVRRYAGGGQTTVSAGTDWITPRASITFTDWQVRGTYISFLGTPTTSAITQTGNSVLLTPVGTVGNWYDFNTTRTFYWSAITTTFGTPKLGLITARFEIRNKNFAGFNTSTSVEDGAPIAGSGVYSVEVEALTLN